MTDLFGIDAGTAEFSPCGTYRYTLTREWDDGKCVSWLCLNPSTATAELNDATVRKIIGFSQRWGYGRMILLNLFALRSTDPRGLARNTDPVGPQNDWFITKALEESRELICAWGCKQHLVTPSLAARPARVLSMVPQGVQVMCLGRRKDGAPRHPLMLAYGTEREAF